MQDWLGSEAIAQLANGYKTIEDNHKRDRTLNRVSGVGCGV
jgi:hypothetical protein